MPTNSTAHATGLPLKNIVAMFYLDLNCRVIGLNQNAERITGRSMADLLGKSMHDILQIKGESCTLNELFAKVSANESAIQQVTIRQAKNGEDPVGNQEIISIGIMAFPVRAGKQLLYAGCLANLAGTDKYLYQRLISGETLFELSYELSFIGSYHGRKIARFARQV